MVVHGWMYALSFGIFYAVLLMKSHLKKAPLVLL